LALAAWGGFVEQRMALGDGFFVAALKGAGELDERLQDLAERHGERVAVGLEDVSPGRPPERPRCG
jgi:hypothetical protein